MGATATPTVAAAAAAGAATAYAASPAPSEQAVAAAVVIAEARYAAVHEHLRTADTKAGLIATVQAAALGILLASPPPAGRPAHLTAIGGA